jgi:hypothetical protein
MSRPFFLAIAATVLLSGTFAAALALARAPQVDFALEDVRSGYRAGDPIMLVWRMTNRTKRPIDVRDATVTPGQSHFDAIVIKVARLDGGGSPVERTIYLTGMATAAQKSIRRLKPGESIVHRFDLAAFGPINGMRFEAGRYRLKAIFDPVGTNALSRDDAKRLFSRRLEAAPVTLVILP